MKLISLSEIELQEVEWLWYPYIPFGKITVIQGDPGEGKTTLGLRHIGNNLNQLTWRVNEGTLTAVNLEETKRELAKIFELLNEKMKGA